MHNELAPPGIAPPAANYAHAVRSLDVSAMVHTSGVVPTKPDGTVPESIVEQAEVVWTTITALLGEADMTMDDVVSVTTYVVVEQMGSLAEVMAARDRALGGRRAASTLVTVPALARPEWKLEIAVVATS